MNYAYRRFAGCRAGWWARHAAGGYWTFDQDSDRLKWRRMPNPAVAEWKRAATAMADWHADRPEHSIKRARFGPVIFTGFSARRANEFPAHAHDPMLEMANMKLSGISKNRMKMGYPGRWK
ncbi:hypothetical protein [Burkholderia stagnalis]|uniref:hypothetical protein n=1 Tax=Burkholderia stagnalis TaxID=1503054 RepID=UPI0012D9FF97|nr:hypothetical protein [Burkholderia stagnalis]